MWGHTKEIKNKWLGVRNIPDFFTNHHLQTHKKSLYQQLHGNLRWLNTVLAFCEYMSFAKSWQQKGCCSPAETWQVKHTLMKDFGWQVEFDVFLVSMATRTIEYNLKISLLLSLHKIHSLDFPINLHTADYN